ncbi:LTA synthase family protein [Telluribacter sp. SYSU D00476]|uniref:LTA synthase family protein n=1 Tax=Telluribacter sp. SYSU D00476 TaxID=2811430 RepID=UPI001FF37EAF|nr:LTA synthase family protein [Telluribacter sp. SYSU D00476]
MTFVELGYSAYEYGLADPLWPVVGRAVLNDLFYFLKSTLFLFIAHSAFTFLSLRVARSVFAGIVLLLVAMQLSLMKYFLTSLALLGSDLFIYSLNDIIQTAGAAGAVSLLGVLGFLVFIGLVWALFYYVSPRIPTHRWVALALPLLSVAFIWSEAEKMVEAPQFGNEYLNYLSYNKSLYFTNASYTYFLDDSKDEGVDIYSDMYLGVGETLSSGESKLVTVNYIGAQEFPFLHREETPDVLGPYFKKSASKPNIVIIVVEGLGRAFTGEDPYLGSFTPFLDSLSSKSLVWANFLSEGGRTFAVLPSILGSAPFAKSGFNDLADKIPAHFSLMNVLKKNGYSSSFYYGGNSSFDNMNVFLRKAGIGEIYDESSFGSGIPKMPSSNGFTWGYDDRELFNHFFRTNSQAIGTPKLNIILTVSMHSPFLINNQEVYMSKVEQRMTELAFSEEQKEKTRPYKQMLSTILFTDGALRDFFRKYSQRTDFQNTIFLITGDHRMPEIPMTTKIDRYHVPLIIYSPLLSRTAYFRSISTHFDITPSLVAFLSNNYAVSRPAVTSWLGTGIDTVRQFRNVHSYPFMVTKAEMVDYIMGNYMLSRNELYDISANMDLSLIDDQSKRSSLQSTFELFKQKNSRILNGSRLVPDSALVKFNL